MGAVLFDDSLSALIDVLVRMQLMDLLDAGLVVRDAAGRLSLVVDRELEPELLATLTAALEAALGPYARAGRVLEARAGATGRFSSAPRLFHRVHDRVVRVIDRRIVGADWVRAPAPAVLGRFVFTSVKGGVGRTTALAITAAHLAAAGKRVLAIDLDLEAPGLGAMLLDEGTTPELGALDYLVENGFGSIDAVFLADLRGPCGLAPRGGKIDVVPAFGRRSQRSPGEVLAKIARAYLEDIDGESALSLRDQVRALVDELSVDYDVVLIDARAGLHEMAAAPLLGLGAEVLLFGLDERQTFMGYAALLAHLAHFIEPGAETPEWTERLNVVHAKAAPTLETRFEERWAEVVRAHFLGAPNGAPGEVAPAVEFHDPPWDEDAEVGELDHPLLRAPIVIPREEVYARFDPIEVPRLLEPERYRPVFGALLDFVDASLTAGSAP